MDEKIKFGLIGFVLGALIVWVVMTNYSTSQNLGMMRSNYTGMMNSSNVDAHFIEQMIPHHEDAISMAKVALQKAQHTEIKTLANNVITSQSAENSQMKSWYKDWFGRELPTGTEVMQNHGMMGEQSTNFDRAFIEEMIPHHQMAVMMANMLKSGTTRPEMKKLADDIITAQTKEIEQMRAWYREWGYE